MVNPKNVDAFFDFDAGEITTGDDADIYLSVSCGTDCFNDLIDINGAVSARFGETEPEYDDCRKVLRDKNGLPASIVPGTYSCIYTNGGNIAKILVIKNEALSRNANLILEYAVWYLSP